MMEGLEQRSVLAQVTIWNDLAWAKRREDSKHALELAQKAFLLAQTGETPYQKGLANALCAQAAALLYQANFPQALEIAKKGIAALKQIQGEEESIWMARAMYVAAVCYGQVGYPTEALNLAFEQLNLSEKINDMEGQASACMVIGARYYAANDYEQTLVYQKKALFAFEQLNQPYGIIVTQNNASESSSLLGDVDASFAYAMKSLKMVEAGLGNLRAHQLTFNRLGEIYASKKEFDQALTYFQRALDLAEDGVNPDTQGRILLAISELQLKLNKPQQALTYLAQLAPIIEKTQNQSTRYEHLRISSAVHKMLGNFEQALEAYEQFHQIKESAASEKSNHLMQNLEVLYQTETAKKDANHYASLYEVEQTRRQLEEILNEIGRSLISTLDLDTVFAQILTHLSTLVHFDRGGLLLKKDQVLSFVAAQGYPEDANPLNLTIKIHDENEQDVFVRIHVSKQPLAIDDVRNYKGWQSSQQLKTPGSWLGVPIIQNNEVVGLLSLVRDKKDPYKEENISLAVTFAAQAAIALNNATLYAQIRQFNQKLEEEVAKKTENLRVAYEQLERLDKAKSDFIGITAHELRTPIAVIKGYGQILDQEKAIKENSYYKSLTSGIVSGTTRLYEIVNRMLLMTKIDNHTLKVYPEPVLIQELITELVTEWQWAIEERKQTLIVDAQLHQLPTIQADKELLLIALGNLLVNAIKYSPDGGEIKLNGRLLVAENLLELSVKDSGIGVHPDHQELIFTKFYQTGDIATHSSSKIQFKGGGPGLGLAIAKGIVTAHKGKLWLESAEYDEQKLPGSQLYIHLPIK